MFIRGPNLVHTMKRLDCIYDSCIYCGYDRQPSRGGEKRWKLFGKTVSDRYLVVVFTIRRKLFRTVTAYEMNATEKRKYATQID